MSNKSVFISFNFGLDKHYRNLLVAWDANTSFDFKFTDRSVKVPINSTDASRVKAGITPKIKSAKYCLVIIGEETYKSEWVEWEIKKAKELGLKLVGVKIKNSYTSPFELRNSKASWASNFTLESIVNALNNA
ncbi:TIR domain-containing protein [Exiguobacterium acetylicum]|uniref:TIR domain-containing protein n=1 Tax=Exiguobacterium acetylicum TaxID=41170 RepID=UPI003877873D